jgi:hypothetical protein
MVEQCVTIFTGIYVTGPDVFCDHSSETGNHGEEEDNDDDPPQNDDVRIPQQMGSGGPQRLQSLFCLSKEAVLQHYPQHVLKVIAATALMRKKSKEFELRSNIQPVEDPFRPGHTVDIVAYPELSESGEYYCSSFYDVTHSITKCRSNVTSPNKPGILGGYLECWKFVAGEGKTPLTLSTLEDSPDMMSMSIAKTLFCRQVENRMRVLARTHPDPELRLKFHATADACEWVRIYAMTFLEPGISAIARTQGFEQMEDKESVSFFVVLF